MKFSESRVKCWWVYLIFWHFLIHFFVTSLSLLWSLYIFLRKISLFCCKWVRNLLSLVRVSLFSFVKLIYYFATLCFWLDVFLDWFVLFLVFHWACSASFFWGHSRRHSRWNDWLRPWSWHYLLYFLFCKLHRTWVFCNLNLFYLITLLSINTGNMHQSLYIQVVLFYITTYSQLLWVHLN